LNEKPKIVAEPETKEPKTGVTCDKGDTLMEKEAEKHGPK